MTPTPPAWKLVPCPTCGAEPGEQCANMLAFMRKPHVARVRAYLKDQERTAKGIAELRADLRQMFSMPGTGRPRRG